LRRYAKALDQSVLSSFDSFHSNLGNRRKGWRVDRRIIDSYRINPSHYDAIVLEMIRHAQKQAPLTPLGEIISDNDISGGATPRGAYYPDTGIFFVRVQNVKPLRLDLLDAAYLSKAQDEELKRSRCKANDVILTITGYPGTAAVVLEEDPYVST
jgi:type I restriction enzyme S subunit